MRVERMIFHVLAVATLGCVSMAQSSTGSASQQDGVEKSSTQREMGQQNRKETDMPASMSRAESNKVGNGSESEKCDKAPCNGETDPRTQVRIENIEKLTEAQQSQQ